MLGTQPFELYEYRSQPMGARSGEGDVDCNVYGMAKWIRLICDGNPSQLLPLIAPDDKPLAVNYVGRSLRQNASHFLARSHAKKFLGYLNGQRMRMTGEKAGTPNRPELVEKYGFDTKFASTALRIAIQGIQLMKTGRLRLPMEDHEAKYLIKVRQGEYTLGEVLAKLGRYEEELLHAGQYSTVLRDQIDYDYVNGWLVSIYERWWSGDRG